MCSLKYRFGFHTAAILFPSWWNLLNFISKQDGKIFCRRTACDCQNPSVDLFCCPECDTRVTSQCLDQNGHKLYRSGDNWTHSCQQCRCLVCQLPLLGVSPLSGGVTNSLTCALWFPTVCSPKQGVWVLWLRSMCSAWRHSDSAI